MPSPERSGYNDGQLSFDALWAEPERARDEQVRPHGDPPLADVPDPDRFQAIPEHEREAFFAELGEQAAAQIEELRMRSRDRTRWGRGTWRRSGG